MKLTHSLVAAVLLGFLSYSDVQAIKLKESESAELMASIDVDLEQMHKKHNKKHRKAKKHHKKSHQRVQTEEASEKDEDAPAPKKKDETKKEQDGPKTVQQEQDEEATKRAEKKVAKFKEKSEIRKDDAEDARVRVENARQNANATYDELKAKKAQEEKVDEEVKKATEG